MTNINGGRREEEPHCKEGASDVTAVVGPSVFIFDKKKYFVFLSNELNYGFFRHGIVD